MPMLSLCLAGLLLPMNEPFAGASWLTVPTPKRPVEEAQWIWAQYPNGKIPNVGDAQPGKVRFVKTWNLPAKPTQAKLSFAADNLAKVRINGKEVGESKAWDRLTEVDVATALKTGDNLVEVEAENNWSQGISNPAGLLLGIEAKLPGNRSAQLLSNKDWTTPDGKVVPIGPYNSAPWRLPRGEVPCPVFWRQVRLGGNLTKATVKIIGLGHYDLFINGKRQGDGIMNQAWSQYDKTLYWQEFEVHRDLIDGLNTISVQLGNSFYRVVDPPIGRYTKRDAMPDFSGESPFLLCMEMDVNRGEKLVSRVVTDKDWRYADGPYKVSHVFAGEDYDARQKNIRGEGSEPVVTVKPKAQLLKMDWPSVKIQSSYLTSKPIEPKPGVWTFQTSQNTAAIIRFKVKGKPGQVVKFRPSEVVNSLGEVQQLNLWGSEASCSYTIGSNELEEHEWRFWYHGFQAVEVTGAVPQGKPNPSGLPEIVELAVCPVRTNNQYTGSFQSSFRLFNQIRSLIGAAMTSNMNYVMTDCPHREKLGWLEQAHLMFQSYAYCFDVRAWFHKIARDIRDAQLLDGRITTVAPDYLMLPPENHYKFTVEWGAAGVLMPWQAYQWYGDRKFLTDSYSSMKRFVDWISANSKDGLAPEGLGDWYDYEFGQAPGPSKFTATNLSSTAMWAMCLDAVAKTADVLGKPQEAIKYRQKWQSVKKAFWAKFYDPVAKRLVNKGSLQTGHSMALYADLVPANQRKAFLDLIIEELKERGYQQTTGDIGHLYFIRTLAEAGRSDILHRVYSRDDTGSYGGMIHKGLTSLPETWDAITQGSNSLNHCMLGHAMEWFYGYALGIRQAPGSVGWKNILIAPEPGYSDQHRDYSWRMDGQIATPLGKVTLKWNRSLPGVDRLDDFDMEVEIPIGAKATLLMPVPGKVMKLNGKYIQPKPGLFGRPSVEVGWGKYTLTSRI